MSDRTFQAWVTLGIIVAIALLVWWATSQRPDKDPIGVNQCLRSQLFKLCIETSKPDENTDRESLVEACGEQAYRQARLRKSAVQPEQCWVPG